MIIDTKKKTNKTPKDQWEEVVLNIGIKCVMN